MKPVLVAYATREGHTERVALHIADVLRTRGLQVAVRDTGDDREQIEMSDYCAAILAASIHRSKHEDEMVEFVARHRPDLEKLPSAFFSISLTEAGVEDAGSDPEKRKEASETVATMMNEFFAQTCWHPDRASPVAGALMYRRYNLLIRWVMKRIASSAEASTDTSRDHVYTDWEALDRFVDDFARELPGYRPAATRAEQGPHDHK